ncbi:MAG: hypothetical protein ACR2LK_07940 [Solirubrobacteraceae bacterium]
MPTPSPSAGDVVNAEVDGVPLLWADVPGPLTAMLMFRIGRSDETLRTLGVTHLVEHLALWSSRRATHFYNGYVEDAVTGFHASGRPEEVCEFLRDVTSSLTALPVDRLEVERRVLGAESASRGGGGAYAHHRALRFGPCGYGLVDQYEYAIDWMDGDALQSHALEHFTADNAVLWLSGPPPDDLSLTLPRGVHRAPAAPEAIPGVVLPAHVEEPDHAGVSMSTLGTRSAALHAGFGVLLERAVEQLRLTAGMSYAPQGAYDVLDGTSTIPVVYADCRVTDASEARRVLVKIADDLAEGGPSEDELERDRRRLVDWLEDPDAGCSHLDWHARNRVLGLPAMSPADLRAEREALSAGVVARTIAEALESLLVISQVGYRSGDGRRLAPYEAPEVPAQQGRRHATTAQWRAFNLDMTVDVSEEGLTYTQSYTKKGLPDGHSVSMLFSDLVTGVRMPSGGLTLVSRAGAYLTLHPERLTDGAELLETLERALGSERILPLSASQRAMVEAVAAQLEPADASGLGGEIDMLPGMLGEREELCCLAAARRDDQEGLVAVTNERMLYLFSGPQGLEGVEVLRGEASTSIKGAIRKRLAIEHGETTTTLHSFRPSERMHEVAGLLLERG